MNLMLAFILAASTGAVPVAARDFRSDPPAVASLEVVARPGASANQSVLKVRFATVVPALWPNATAPRDARVTAA